MTFRPPRGDDYFGSYLRKHVFQQLPRRELTIDVIFDRANEDKDSEGKVLLTDDDNPLPKWQDEDAPHHWQCEFTHSGSPCPFYFLERLVSNYLILAVMKEVLPDIYWETF
jgi:hypothetical protein